MPVRSQHGTLVADTVTTVTITGCQKGLRVQRISTSSTAPLWWACAPTTTTTATPTTAGADDTYRLAADMPPDYLDDPPRALDGTIIVKLICADAVGYSVETW